MWKITYLDKNTRSVLSAKDGQILLEVLKKNQVNVYGSLSKQLNCGGKGLCATCGVYLLSEDTKAHHWHDRLAKAFGYPRLSCQIKVKSDLTIQKPEGKIIWGQLLPNFKTKK